MKSQYKMSYEQYVPEKGAKNQENRPTGFSGNKHQA